MRVRKIFFLLFFSYINALQETFKIRGNFQLCEATDRLIETSIASMDSQLFNILAIIKNLNREFAHIKLPSNEILNVFSFNGHLFFANCSEKQVIYIPLTQSKCSSELLVYIDTNKTKEFFFNHKTRIISEKTVFSSCENIKKKKFYIDSYEVFDKIKIRILKSSAKVISFQKHFKKNDSNNTEALIRLNNTLELLKVEINQKNVTITPSPLKNLLINEEKILNIIKEKESEIADEVSKFFANSILNKKILVGISIIFVYLFLSFLLLRFLYLMYIKIGKHPSFVNSCLRNKNNLQKKDEILEIGESDEGSIISKHDFFLNSFFKSFTNFKDNEYLEKIKEEKKLTKNSLINIEDVSRIRKGLDCVHDVDITEVECYFYKNAKPQLQIIIDMFNSSDFYCPSCEKKISGKSVACEKCDRLFDIKCVKTVRSGKWHCHNGSCKQIIKHDEL
jgi:hypothetical protein